MLGSDDHPSLTVQRAAVFPSLDTATRRGHPDPTPPIRDANNSKPRPSGSSWATREAENVPTAPLSNVAVNVATSSFSTCHLAGDLGLGVAIGDSEQDGTRSDHRREGLAPDLDDRSAHEFTHVDQMAADVCQGTRSRAPAVAPRDRRRRVQPVVAPVVPVEVDDVARSSRREFAPDLLHRRRTAVGVPDASLGPLRSAAATIASASVREPASGFSHSTCLPAATPFDDLAVQLVGDDDADGVDVGRFGNGLPAVLGALIPVPTWAVSSATAWLVSAIATSRTSGRSSEQRGRRAVSGGMGSSGHAATDDGDTDGFIRHCVQLLVSTRHDSD